MAKGKPTVRPGETYTAPNFVRVYTASAPDSPGLRLATIEHLSCRRPGGNDRFGWQCATIADAEAMSKEDALFIARNYALTHGIPVIYESHRD